MIKLRTLVVRVGFGVMDFGWGLAAHILQELWQQFGNQEQTQTER